MHKLFLKLLIGLCLFADCAAQAVSNNPISAWVQMGDSGQIWARAVIKGQDCPVIKLDNIPYRMQLRAESSKKFPITVCELALPTGVQSAVINQEKLPLPVKNLKRIVILGDTGCRLKLLSMQACNDPQQWPLPKIISQAAQFKPDLVIHLGDYFYRETPCLPSNQGCARSPYGDNWESWRADFLGPARVLFKKAPWIFVRGNHEICQRGGNGWNRLLSLSNYRLQKCVRHEQPYTVKFTNLQFFVMDSSSETDRGVFPLQVGYFKEDFEKLNLINKPVWLLTHKPLWTTAMLKSQRAAETEPYVTSLQKASQNYFSSNVKAIFSGHIHTFETVNFANRPAQIIVGNSGTKLDNPPADSHLKGLNLTNEIIIDGINLNQFGYLALELKSQRWRGKVYSPGGQVIATCQLKARHFLCKENEE